ncbi:MAG: DUF262 domain-containing protein [Methanophagales archaeon]|nr:DUF262 domain-containing protein [Methanophagales archaeon]
MERGLTNLKDLVIGDRTFQIPIYQRNYSWEKKQWDDLWNDLVYLKYPDKKHYFGTLLMKKTKKKKESGLKSFEVYEMIDGQQRIATILILLREIIPQLNEIDDKDIREELKRLKEDYLKYRDVYKLELLGSDKEFFRKHIIDGEEYPDEILTPSQRRLGEAKTFFRKKIEEVKENSTSDKFRGFLLEFKQKIDSMEIIRYEVGNDADAVLIFETVNDRGKPLTNLEKTKSFLMHTIYLSAPEELVGYLNEVNESFSKIFRWFEEIVDTERGKNLGEDDIQRYHFVIYEKEAEKRREISYQYLSFLKEKIRRLYREDNEQSLNYALEYTKDLEKAFFTMKEIITFGKENRIGKLLTKIFTLERVANFYPLLIATWIRFRNEKEKIESILSLIEVIVFRVYSIRRRRADTGESWLYDLAYRVHREDLQYNMIIKELGELIRYYEEDIDFERDLKVENFYDRIARRDKIYLLFEYEKFLREQSREPLDIRLEDILTPKFEIEHIWPDDASKLNLSEDLKEIHEQCKDKLGNLTIASKSWNARWGNESFETKRKEYQNSTLRIQKELSDFEEWNKEQIEKRETHIIKFAIERWKV